MSITSPVRRTPAPSSPSSWSSARPSWPAPPRRPAPARPRGGRSAARPAAPVVHDVSPAAEIASLTALVGDRTQAQVARRHPAGRNGPAAERGPAGREPRDRAGRPPRHVPPWPPTRRTARRARMPAQWPRRTTRAPAARPSSSRCSRSRQRRRVRLPAEDRAAGRGEAGPRRAPRARDPSPGDPRHQARPRTPRSSGTPAPIATADELPTPGGRHRRGAGEALAGPGSGWPAGSRSATAWTRRS